MNSELKITNIELKGNDNQSHIHKIYMSKDRSSAIFQYRFYWIQGLKVTEMNVEEFLCSGLDLECLTLEKTRHTNRMIKRKLFQKILDQDFDFYTGEIKINLPYINKEDLETSKFSQMNLHEFFHHRSKDLYQSNYLKGMFYQYGIVYKKDLDKAITHYERGAKKFGCHSCCFKLAQRHLESTEFDDHEPSLDFKKVLTIFGELWFNFGIIELEGRNLEIKAPMLEYLGILMDTSQEFRKFVFTCIQDCQYLLQDLFNFKKIQEIYSKILKNRSILYKICLMLVLEMDYTNQFFLYSYEIIVKLSLYTEFKKLNSFLGDLNHPCFFGNRLNISLDRRFQFYSLGENWVKLKTLKMRSVILGVVKNRREIYEEEFKNIAQFISKKELESHPQIMELILGYYFNGGKADLKDLFPNLYSALPKPQCKELEEERTEDGDMFEMNQLESWEYFKEMKSVNYNSLGYLLNFFCINGQYKYLKSYFILLKHFYQDHGHRIAIKGIKMGGIMDHFPVIIINQEKGKQNPKKFERALQGYYDFLENWIKLLHMKKISDCLNDKLFSSQPSDFSQSYVFLMIFRACLSQNSNNYMLLNHLKIAFTYSLYEIEDILAKGHKPNFYSFYTCFWILELVDDKKMASEVIKYVLLCKSSDEMFTISSSLFFNELKREGKLENYVGFLPKMNLDISINSSSSGEEESRASYKPSSVETYKSEESQESFKMDPIVKEKARVSLKKNSSRRSTRVRFMFETDDQAEKDNIASFKQCSSLNCVIVEEKSENKLEEDIQIKYENTLSQSKDRLIHFIENIKLRNRKFRLRDVRLESIVDYLMKSLSDSISDLASFFENFQEIRTNRLNFEKYFRNKFNSADFGKGYEHLVYLDDIFFGDFTEKKLENRDYEILTQKLEEEYNLRIIDKREELGKLELESYWGYKPSSKNDSKVGEVEESFEVMEDGAVIMKDDMSKEDKDRLRRFKMQERRNRRQKAQEKNRLLQSSKGLLRVSNPDTYKKIANFKKNYFNSRPSISEKKMSDWDKKNVLRQIAGDKKSHDEYQVEKYNDITIYNSQFLENEQKVKVVEVKIRTNTHLTNIIENLEFVNTIHPSILSVLGVYSEDRISYFLIGFVYDDYDTKYNEKMNQIYEEARSFNEFFQVKIYNIYKILMGYLSLKISGMLCYYLNTKNIVLDHRGEPKIFIPFFLKNFKEKSKHFQLLLSTLRHDKSDSVLDDYSVKSVKDFLFKDNHKYSDKEMGYLIACLLVNSITPKKNKMIRFNLKKFEKFGPESDLKKIDEKKLEKKLRKIFKKNRFAIEDFDVSRFLVKFISQNYETSDQQFSLVSFIRKIEEYLNKIKIPLFYQSFIFNAFIGFGNFKKTNMGRKKTVLPCKLTMFKVPNTGDPKSKNYNFTYDSNLIFTLKMGPTGVKNMTYYFNNVTRVECQFEDSQLVEAEIFTVFGEEMVNVQIENLEKNLRMKQIKKIYKDFSSLKEEKHLSAYLKGVNMMKNIRNKIYDAYTKRYIESGLVSELDSSFREEFNINYIQIIKNFTEVVSLFTQFKEWMKDLAGYSAMNNHEGFRLSIFDIFGNRILGNYSNDYKLDYKRGVMVRRYNPSDFMKISVFSNLSSNSSCYFETDFSKSCFSISNKQTLSHLALTKQCSEFDSKFAICQKYDGSYFCGQVKRGKYHQGVIFDSQNNFYSYSKKHSYKGQTYNSNTEISYVGMLHDGLAHGFGMLLHDNLVRYIGKFYSGLPHGKGMIFKNLKDKDMTVQFIGQLRMGVPLSGTFEFERVIYDGVLPQKSRNHILRSVTKIDDDDIVKEETLRRRKRRQTNLLKFNSMSPNYKPKMSEQVINKNHEVEDIKTQMVSHIINVKGSFPNIYEDLISKLEIKKGSAVLGKVYNHSEKVLQVNGMFSVGKLALRGYYQVFYKNGNFFQGGLNNQERRGPGFFVSSNGLSILGNWNFNTVSGICFLGKTKSKFRHIIGNFKFDSKGNFTAYGNVKIEYKNGDVYRGQMMNRSFTGFGKFISKEKGVVYMGQFYKNKKHGIGFFKNSKMTYKGEFRNDKMHGYGILITPKLIVKGLWKQDYCLIAKITFLDSSVINESVSHVCIIFEEKTHYENIEEKSLKGYGQIELKIDEERYYKDVELLRSLKKESHSINKNFNPFKSVKSYYNQGQKRSNRAIKTQSPQLNARIIVPAPANPSVPNLEEIESEESKSMSFSNDIVQVNLDVNREYTDDSGDLKRQNLVIKSPGFGLDENEIFSASLRKIDKASPRFASLNQNKIKYKPDEENIFKSDKKNQNNFPMGTLEIQAPVNGKISKFAKPGNLNVSVIDIGKDNSSLKDFTLKGFIDYENDSIVGELFDGNKKILKGSYNFMLDKGICLKYTRDKKIESLGEFDFLKLNGLGKVRGQDYLFYANFIKDKKEGITVKAISSQSSDKQLGDEDENENLRRSKTFMSPKLAKRIKARETEEKVKNDFSLGESDLLEVSIDKGENSNSEKEVDKELILSKFSKKRFRCRTMTRLSEVYSKMSDVDYFRWDQDDEKVEYIAEFNNDKMDGFTFRRMDEYSGFMQKYRRGRLVEIKKLL